MKVIYWRCLGLLMLVLGSWAGWMSDRMISSRYSNGQAFSLISLEVLLLAITIYGIFIGAALLMMTPPDPDESDARSASKGQGGS